LSAVAGDIAYAIVLILACRLVFAKPVHSSRLRNDFLLAQGLGPCVRLPLSASDFDCWPV
jgi:hypothetical protein